MSHLLYLQSFPWERLEALRKASPKIDPFEVPRAKLALKAISPMGIGATMLDAYAEHFEAVKAKALLRKLRERFVFSPEEVASAATTLRAIAALEDPEADPDFEDTFREELLEPFESAAKAKRRGVLGEWG